MFGRGENSSSLQELKRKRGENCSWIQHHGAHTNAPLEEAKRGRSFHQHARSCIWRGGLVVRRCTRRHGETYINQCERAGPRRLRHPPSTKGDGLGQQPAGAGPRTCPEPVYPRPAWCAVGCNMMLYVQHRRSCRASSTSSPGDGRRSASEQWARCHERRLRRLHVDRWLRGSKVALC